MSSEDGNIALCASCDRCRSRKTKCDGKRPCSNCANKYMKKHKLSSLDGVDPNELECVYSPAKRRGPVPGKSSAGSTRKAGEAFSVGSGNNNGMEMDWQSQQVPPIVSSSADMSQQVQQMMGTASSQMTLIQKLQQQQQQQQQQMGGNGVADVPPMNGMMGSSNDGDQQPLARRLRREPGTEDATDPASIPKTIASHTHLLERSDTEGNRLRAYYRLSIDELYRLPLTPSDEEYCAKLNASKNGDGDLMTPATIPGAHLAALSASRFAEISLGAVVHQEISLAMELCNAVVHCLRECVQEPVQDPYLYEVARAYFLLGVFRACRGDMERYFKYRRVALAYAAKLPDDTSTQTLMAAISYLDSWAYMIYNADEEKLPSVEGSVPQIGGCGTGSCSQIATDPKNSNWIQGAPPVYLNNEAPLPARALDALACAVRSCCDQANSRFAAIARAAELGQSDLSGTEEQSALAETPTATAVMANNNELCSRNLVLSAFTLMQQYEATSASALHKSQGQRMVISAMDAFLENSDEDGSGGFTDSQIQSLLSVCNTAIENPFLLHHAGPSYHMVTNAAVLLCHLLNGMYAMKGSQGKLGEMEMAMFEEVLDTLIAVRKLLTIHRRKLPVKLRCHGIPRPSLNIMTSGTGGTEEKEDEFAGLAASRPLIDLGETILCACRGCQGFVLMACSPCVAAERAMAAQERLEVEDAREQEAVETGDLDRELDDLGAEFDLDDDALLGMISQLITN